MTLLDQLGYQVVAASGRPENHEWLKSIGADRVIERAELQEPARPLEKQLWAGCIDTVGGKVLAKVLAPDRLSGRGSCLWVGWRF